MQICVTVIANYPLDSHLQPLEHATQRRTFQLSLRHFHISTPAEISQTVTAETSYPYLNIHYDAMVPPALLCGKLHSKNQETGYRDIRVLMKPTISPQHAKETNGARAKVCGGEKSTVYPTTLPLPTCHVPHVAR
jgi:hypothetical protein